MNALSDWDRKQKIRQQNLKGTTFLAGSFRWVYPFLLVLLIGLPLTIGATYAYKRFSGAADVPLELSGTSILVKKGGDLQAALNRAKPGDTILLEAGAVFRGNFILPNKQGNDFVTIRSAAQESQLPPPDTRIDPKKFAATMPKILTNSDLSALSAAKAAHNYRIIGVEFSSDTDKYVYNLVLIGDEQRMEDIPHDIEFDRCYFHPNSKGKIRRGFGMNGREVLVKNSYFSGFGYQGEEAQAICGWSGPGPYKILNNYLEGGAENVMFGGATAGIKGMIPSDIEIRGNYMTKPPEWRTSATIKCVFELKNARRVNVTGNVFENAFDQMAIRLTIRGEEGTSYWSTVEDVLIENNIIRNSGGGINFLGHDDGGKSDIMKRVKVNNNLFTELGGAKWGGNGRFMLISDGEDISVTNNTVFNNGAVLAAYGTPSKRFTLSGNIIQYNDYGFTGDNVGAKDIARQYFPNSVISKNVIVNNMNLPKEQVFVPMQNYYAANLAALGFENTADGKFQLSLKSAFKGKGINGKDPGLDFIAFQAAFGGKKL